MAECPLLSHGIQGRVEDVQEHVRAKPVHFNAGGDERLEECVPDQIFTLRGLSGQYPVQVHLEGRPETFRQAGRVLWLFGRVVKPVLSVQHLVS